jgi:F-type H+-transporting ATPase subunit alpha
MAFSGLRLTSLSAQARNAAPAAFNAASIQARSYAADAKAAPTEVSSILEQRIRGVQEESGLAETGRVLSVGYVQSGRQN